MLTLAKVQRHRIAYYLGATRVVDRTRLGLVEKDGVFLGSLTAGLGLCAWVPDQQCLPALLDAIHPATGEVLDPRHERVRNVAFDCTFSAPKSVSLLHGLAPEEIVAEVASGHERSVLEVIGYLEHHAARVRHRDHRRDVTMTSQGLAVASFLHRVSRADDPHLHSHVLVANLGLDEEGRYSALDARPLYEHLAAAGALYRSQLRYELSHRLGLSWKNEQRGFADLLGLPAPALRAFSQRQIAIESELARSGGRGRAAKDYAAARTRPEKRNDLSYDQLRQMWRERAYALGVPTSRFSDAVVNRSNVQTRFSAEVPSEQAVLLEAAQAALGQFDRPFVTSELVSRTANRSRSGSPVSRIEAAVQSTLDNSAVERAEDARTSPYFARSGSRIPSGSEQARYVSTQFQDQLLAVKRLFAGATDLSANLLQERASGHCALERIQGVGIINGLGCDRLGEFSLLHRLADQASAFGRRVFAVTANDAGAAAFEALTGVCSLSARALPQDFANALVLIPESDRLSPAALLEIRQRQSHEGAMLCLQVGRASTLGDDHNARAHGAEAQPGALDVGLSTPFAYKLGEVRVVQCADAVELVESATAMAKSLEQSGKEAIVLAPEPALLDALAEGAIARKELMHALRRHPDARLVVIGGAGLLGGALTRVNDEQRIHLVVQPLCGGRENRRGQALLIGQPKYLRDRLGNAPKDLPGREKWQARALALEYGRSLTPSHSHAARQHSTDRQRLQLSR